MKEFLYHLFVPHSKNNHRAKLLHNSSIAILIVYLLFINFIAISVKHSSPQVLGVSYSITVDELLSLTNKARQEKGLKPLALNNELSTAAQMKAQDMLVKNYWAHFAPDGTSPWYFVKNSGYVYAYAGENLAKGFTTTSDAQAAWMNSTSHRENILSDKYNDVGFAVTEGQLIGEDTVLIVEMFGSEQLNPVQTAQVQTDKTSNIVSNTLPEKTVVAGNSASQPNKEKTTVSSKNIHTLGEKKHTSFITNPILESTVFSKSILVILFSILILAFVIDLIVVERNKIPRLVGHNIDHIMIIVLFIIFVIIQRNGFIV